MIDLLEEMKNHSLVYVFFRGDKFKVELSSGEVIQTSTPELLTAFLKAVHESDGAQVTGWIE